MTCTFDRAKESKRRGGCEYLVVAPEEQRLRDTSADPLDELIRGVLVGGGGAP
jgi:hypothetical protein